MAEDKSGAATEAAEKPKKSKLGLILILANLVVIGGGFAYVALFTDLLGGKEASAQPEGEQPKVEEEVKDSEYASLDPFVVNLNEPGAPRYIKLSISVECAGNQDKLAASTPRVRDGILTYLSGLRLTEVQGRDAKEGLRQELVKILQQTVQSDEIEIRGVLFTEFVVQ